MKNIYVTPQTSVQIIAVTHVLMVSGDGPSLLPGNVNNTPEDNIIGG
jgi:hypothetical protein